MDDYHQRYYKHLCWPSSNDKSISEFGQQAVDTVSCCVPLTLAGRYCGSTWITRRFSSAQSSGSRSAAVQFKAFGQAAFGGDMAVTTSVNVDGDQPLKKP